MPTPNVILRGVSDLALSTVGALAAAAKNTAGAVSGAAVGGSLGAVRGTTQGAAHGAVRARHSTAAAALTVAAVGAAGLIEWPVLLLAAGTAVTLDKVINRSPTATPDPRFADIARGDTPPVSPRPEAAHRPP